MSKKETSIHRHVRTSVVARIVYRIVCLVLIVTSIFGLMFTFTAADKFHSYDERTETTTATITNVTSDYEKEYDYTSCAIKYEFKLENKTYNSDSSWEKLPNKANCSLMEGDQISVRYQKTFPQNNAYDDNRFGREVALFVTVSLAVVSFILLGIGFVGLVAIHKALKEEDELEDGDQPATEEQMRLIRSGYKKLGLYYAPSRKRITRNAAEQVLTDIEVELNARHEAAAKAENEMTKEKGKLTAERKTKDDKKDN